MDMDPRNKKPNDRSYQKPLGKPRRSSYQKPLGHDPSYQTPIPVRHARLRLIIALVCIAVLLGAAGFCYIRYWSPTASMPVLDPTAVPGLPDGRDGFAATSAPTTVPTAVPTTKPTAVPTSKPTAVPTTKPIVVITTKPTAAPTLKPIVVITTKPTAVPTAKPTAVPTTKPTAIPTQSVSFRPGQVITFGYYANEPIDWYVIDIDRNNDSVLLVSCRAVDVVQYHHSTNTTKWADTDLRYWLNEQFYQAAFSDVQRDALFVNHVSNSYDYVYLLSNSELEAYKWCLGDTYQLVGNALCQTNRTWTGRPIYINEDTHTSSW